MVVPGRHCVASVSFTWGLLALASSLLAGRALGHEIRHDQNHGHVALATLAFLCLALCVALLHLVRLWIHARLKVLLIRVKAAVDWVCLRDWLQSGLLAIVGAWEP